MTLSRLTILFIGLLWGISWSAQAKNVRIIALTPHLTEMVFSAGAGKDLIGVDRHSNYPNAVNQLPKVGDAFHLNLERILSLKPDLILVWKASIKPYDLQRLKKIGLRVFVSNIQTLSDIPKEIEQIGRLAGTQPHAIAIANSLRLRLKLLKTQYAHSTPISVFYQVWNRPYTTINGRQFISQGLSLCGAKNVFADLNPIAPQVNTESLLAANPQIILMGGNPQDQQLWRKDWQNFPMIQAVKHHQIIGVNSDLYQRPTARFIEALPHLCELIQQARQAYQPTK